MLARVPPLSLTAWLRYDTIQRLLPTGRYRILEIGAGLGSVGTLLAERLEYVGLEPDPTSFAAGRRRLGDRGELLNCTIEGLPSSEVFDVICAFEVLEHIDDDRSALGRWLPHLRPGGWMLVSVPRGRDRFGPQDKWVGHYRRYDRADLESLLEHAGLREIVVVAYGFPLGNALERVRNMIARRSIAPASIEERTGASGRWLQPPPWASRVLRTVSAPFRYAQRPFGRIGLGTGFVARGRKAP